MEISVFLGVNGAFVFVLGCAIGSFLNVCIHRMPRGESVAQGRSHCVECGQTIPWHDNVPLVSYLLLRGKCRFCGKRFTFRYFLVELMTGIVWTLLWLAFGWTAKWLCAVVLFSLLIAVTFTDFETGYIPDLLNYPGMILGLVLAAVFPAEWGAQASLESLWYALRGLLLGGGSLLTMGYVGSWMFKKEAMGGGDIKLMAFLGAFLGLPKVLLVLFAAPFFGMPYALFTRLVRKQETFPFGPFIAAAAAWTYFYGDEFLRNLFFF